MVPRLHFRILLVAAACLGEFGCGPGDAGPVNCSEGEILDGQTCVPEACGSGTWGNLQTGSGTVYVNAAADPGGDGSAQAPYDLLQDGLDAQGGSGQVAVAAGTYLENIVMTGEHKGIRVEGRCAELVVVDGSRGLNHETGIEATILVYQTGIISSWHLSGLTLTGSQGAGLYQEYGDLEVERLIVSGNDGYGVFSGYGTFSASDSVFERNAGSNMLVGYATVSLTRNTFREVLAWSDGSGGSGLDLYGSEVTITDCTVEGSELMGVYLNDSQVVFVGTTIRDNGRTGLEATESVISMNGCEITDTRCDASGEYGWGTLLMGGTTIEAVDTFFTGNSGVGLFQSVGEAVLQGCEVSATLATGQDASGQGIESQYGTLEMVDCLVQENRTAGVQVYTGQGVLESCQILETGVASDGTFGRALVVEGGSELLVTDSLVQGAGDVGVFVQDASLVMEDSQVMDTRGDDHGLFGRGIGVQYGDLTLSGCRIEESREIGIFLADATAEITATEVVGAINLDPDETARGICVQEYSSLSLVDSRIENIRGLGLFVLDSEVTVESTQVLDTQRIPGMPMATGVFVQGDAGIDTQLTASFVAEDVEVSGTEGMGLYATHGVVSCASCVLSDNRFAAVAVQSGSEVTLSDSTIEGTLADANYGGGVGVYVNDYYSGTHWDPPTLVLQGTSVQANEMGAVYLVGGGSYDIVDNVLAGGAGVEVPSAAWGHGDAVFATMGESSPTAWSDADQAGLRIRDNVIEESEGAGIFLDGASATVSGNSWADNGVDIVQQACGSVDPPDGVDQTAATQVELCQETDRHIVELFRVETVVGEMEAEY
ncbi:MAG: right-handed parallel beta-helix repeat-containing protein [Myxococcota bacterium]|jgi:hypothetical protein|nr:right-handed parallel beta-helix repeat-containing protein [Myxococcota bacterium]